VGPPGVRDRAGPAHHRTGAVADHAGVGMSALYRRYPSKHQLLAHLAADGLGRYL
jgi:AcrR family transcriptional regulator